MHVCMLLRYVIIRVDSDSLLVLIVFVIQDVIWIIVSAVKKLDTGAR